MVGAMLGTLPTSVLGGSGRLGSLDDRAHQLRLNPTPIWEKENRMSKETHFVIYIAPLLERDFDLFKVGHTTIAGIKGRRSRLRRELTEPKLEIYPIIVYPPGTSISTVLIHERDLIWMVRLRNISLFRHPKIEVVYFPATPAIRFWQESKPDKRDLLLRAFVRAFILGEEGGSSLPIPLHQVTSLLDQHRKQWERLKEVRFEDSRAKTQQECEQWQREWRRQMREQDERVQQEERKEKARLEDLERFEAARRIKTF
jgi:hypothetical protein